jgi:hypothetical protein
MCPSYLVKEMQKVFATFSKYGNLGLSVEGVGEHLRILIVC